MRGIGVKRLTYRQQMEHIAVRTVKRIITTVGRDHVKFMQDTSFSLEATIAPEREAIVEQILLEQGYLKTRTGEFVHKKMRLNDFASMGAMVSLVPKPDTRVLQEAIVDLCKQPACFSWPQVSEEEVQAVEERLKAPHGI
jgi:hypothetical protein